MWLAKNLISLHHVDLILINLLNFGGSREEFIIKQVETIDLRQMIMVLTKFRSEGFSKQKKQIHEIQDESIRSEGDLTESLLLIRVESNCLS